MTRHGPAEGAHLDAKLAILSQQVEERIDALEGRRRVGSRVGIAALVVFALGGAAATAAALTVEAPSTVVVEVPVETLRLQCVEGVDVDAPAFFSVQYTVAAGIPDPLDAVATCRAALDGITRVPVDSTPQELLLEAAGLLVVRDAADTPPVRHATFGEAVGSPAAYQWTACADRGSVAVLAHAAGESPDCEDEG